MTTLTRRDALLLTAAVAAASPALQSAEAANPDPSILDVPSGPVAGSSIPITIRIPQAKFDPKQFPSVRITLQIQHSTDDTNAGYDPIPVFDATFTDKAIGGSEIDLMTRLKIPFREYLNDQTKAPPTVNPAPPQFKANLVVRTTLLDKDGKETGFDVSPPQTITINKEDCAASNISLLRLALQPSRVLKPKEQLTVKAVVPPSQSRTLTTIMCQRSTDKATPFQMNVTKGAFLADEVFVSFNLYPEKTDLLTMTWTYQSAALLPAAAAPGAAPGAAAPSAAAPAGAAAPAAAVANSNLTASAYVVVELSS